MAWGRHISMSPNRAAADFRPGGRLTVVAAVGYEDLRQDRQGPVAGAVAGGPWRAANVVPAARFHHRTDDLRADCGYSGVRPGPPVVAVRRSGQSMVRGADARRGPDAARFDVAAVRCQTSWVTRLPPGRLGAGEYPCRAFRRVGRAVNTGGLGRAGRAAASRELLPWPPTEPNHTTRSDRRSRPVARGPGHPVSPWRG